MTARTPLNIVDQVILHLDHERDPWSIHAEVRVAGRLDGDRVAAAARAATASHPIARARLAPFRRRDRRYFWEIADRVDHLPLEIVNCPDDRVLAQARSRLLSVRVGLDASPPFALTLAHHPHGDALIMNFNHAAGDGVSLVRLMTSICRAYAGVEDPSLDGEALRIRDMRDHACPQSLEDRLMRLRRLGERTSEQRAAGPAARVAVQGGRTDAAGYGVHLLRLDARELCALKQRRRQSATLNDVLLAGLAVAIRRFNDERGIPPARVSIMMPVNLRPAELSEEIVSNIVASATVSVPASAQSDLDAAQAAVVQRTRALKEQRAAGAMSDVVGLHGVWPVGVRRLATRLMTRAFADAAVETVVFSNVGTIARQLDFGEDAGAATEFWISPPARMPMGVAIAAATMNGELFLTIRYCKAQFDAAGAAAFAQTWRDVLLAA